MAQQMKGRKGKGNNRIQTIYLVEQIDFDQIHKYSLYANGVSLVIHPINPFCPTVHANFRCKAPFFVRFENHSERLRENY